MRPLEDALTARGYRVANVAYPSREEPIERLAGRAVGEGLARCSETASGRIHFVAHSLGGILVRYYLAAHEIPRLGRIVMLAPPNHGSEVIDHLRTLPGVATMLGPAGMALGTDPASIPARLGALDHAVGIIAGTATVNPILSRYLPDPDDGKVSVRSARLEGMTDFLALPVSHPFIMRDDEAVRQTVAFIETGAFVHGEMP